MPSRDRRPPDDELAGGRSSDTGPVLVALGCLTLLALVLRLPGIEQGLFGDELFLHEIVTRNGPIDVIRAVHDSESTPPFHFLLAWLTGSFGDSTITTRIPSLLLGTAAVPLTYLLGARTVGRAPTLLGAAFLTLSPFLVFYSDEVRAYATLLFLSALSTLALLFALGARSWVRWAAFAVVTCLLLYTHYTAVFVVAAQAAWALWSHRRRWLELLLAHLAILVGYLPWLPSFAVQSEDSSATRIAAFKSLTPEGSLRELAIAADGHPFVPLREVPGRAAVVLLAVGAAVALAGALLPWLRHAAPAPRRAEDRPGSSALTLIALVALATPLGLAVASLVGQNVYIPRNLTASLPAIALLLAAGLFRLRPALTVAGAAAVLVALGIGAATTFESRYARPAYRQAAHAVDDRATPGSAVVEYPLFPAYANVEPTGGAFITDVAPVLSHHLDRHFRRDHDFIQATGYERSAWDPFARRRRLFVVLPWDAAHRARPPLPPRLRSRFRLVRRQVWQGLVPVALLEYRAVPSERRGS